MKLGVMNPVLYGMSYGDALKYLGGLGVQAIEVGAGGYPGKRHLDPSELLKTPDKIREFGTLADKYGIEICALACHGNPLHPDKETAENFDAQFRQAILTAEILGVKTIVGFSGCPGDCESSKYPNWVTCAWPTDFRTVLNWQWNEKLIPYWRSMAEFAKSHGIERIALEMHPGFCVYNPETLLRLRGAVGDIIGANFDPSHLFWQGIEPTAAIGALAGAIYHFHAKDTQINRRNTEINGVLDTKSYSDVEHRSWVFRTVGYGHSRSEWNDIISALKFSGYDGAISIEHEDGLMSSREGLEKAVALLKDAIIFENAGDPWWI